MKDKNYIIRQISVFIDNRPASLAEMTRRLGRQEYQPACPFTGGNPRIRHDTHHRGRRGRLQRGAQGRLAITSSKPTCSLSRLRTGPGGMADVLECIASEHISVEYAYAMIEKREGSAVIILRVDNTGKAIMALQKRNIRLLTREDIALL